MFLPRSKGYKHYFFIFFSLNQYFTFSNLHSSPPKFRARSRIISLHFHFMIISLHTFTLQPLDAESQLLGCFGCGTPTPSSRSFCTLKCKANWLPAPAAPTSAKSLMHPLPVGRSRSQLYVVRHKPKYNSSRTVE